MELPTFETGLLLTEKLIMLFTTGLFCHGKKSIIGLCLENVFVRFVGILLSGDGRFVDYKICFTIYCYFLLSQSKADSKDVNSMSIPPSPDKRTLKYLSATQCNSFRVRPRKCDLHERRIYVQTS